MNTEEDNRNNAMLNEDIVDGAMMGDGNDKNNAKLDQNFLELIDQAFVLFQNEEKFNDDAFKDLLKKNPFIFENYHLMDLAQDRGVQTAKAMAQLIRTFYPEGKHCEFIKVVDENGNDIGIGYLFHAHPFNDDRSVSAQTEMIQQTGLRVFGYKSVTAFPVLTRQNGERISFFDIRGSQIFDPGKISPALGGHIGFEGEPLLKEIGEEAGIKISKEQMIPMGEKKRQFFYQTKDEFGNNVGTAFNYGFAFVSNVAVILNDEQSQDFLKQMNKKGIRVFFADTLERLKDLLPENITATLQREEHWDGQRWEDLEKSLVGKTIDQREIAYGFLAPLNVVEKFSAQVDPDKYLAYGQSNFLVDQELMDRLQKIIDDKAMINGAQSRASDFLDFQAYERWMHQNVETKDQETRKVIYDFNQMSKALLKNETGRNDIKSVYVRLPWGQNDVMRDYVDDVQSMMTDVLNDAERVKGFYSKLKDLHSTLSTEGNSDMIDFDDVAEQIQNVLQTMSAVRVRIVGPRLMPDLGVILELEALTPDVYNYRRNADKRMQSKPENSSVYVQNILHVTVGYLFQASEQQLEELRRLFQDLREKRDSVEIQADFVEVIQGKGYSASEVVKKKSYQLTDHAALSATPGGIDLSAQKLDLNEQGGTMRFNVSGKDFDPAQLQNIQGFRPIIRSIVPISDIRLLLGLDVDPEKNNDVSMILMDVIGRDDV